MRTYCIYQIPAPSGNDKAREEAYRRYAFTPLRNVDEVKFERYQKVYEGQIENSLEDKWVLEDIYMMLNGKHPEDYKARSLSVSDIIEMDNGKCYYCDSIGWQEVHPVKAGHEACKECRFRIDCEYNQYGINGNNCRYYEEWEDL